MIKQLDKSHEAALFSLIDENRSYLKKWLPWWVDGCTRQSDALHFITSAKDTLEKGTKFMFGIFYKEEMSGIINFNKIDASHDQLVIG
ncbi:MAG: hypothetical protein V3581_00045 [Candidatus Cardinium sp.]|uniref:hypothetical protein n=1 Tax=Candidatus Cardinium sp. TP TaxID=2961955 RepID=UPI0021AFFED8|nr:hypothetical protein [Candidatus Cardinium sp. TP]MCT4696910.1 hypothetical protein [Candidatus Cardinium sp. TP]MDN5246855.1 hypothetical protein [Candidatus Cardinium sp.]